MKRALLVIALACCAVAQQAEAPQVTPEQGLQNLATVASAFKGTLQEHQILQASVASIDAALKELAALKAQQEPPKE